MKKTLSVFFAFVISSQLGATVYYVSTTGSNSNSGTSVANAWLTVSYAASQANLPGDTIYIEPGTYNNENILLDYSGTAGNPITFMPDPAYPGIVTLSANGVAYEPVFQQNVANLSYITIEGLVITDVEEIAALDFGDGYAGSNNIQILNNTLEDINGDNAFAILFYTDNGCGCADTNILISGNTIENVLTDGTGNPNQIVTLGGNISNSQVIGNTITNVDSQAIDILGGYSWLNGSPTNILVQQNIISNVSTPSSGGWGAAIFLDGVSNSIVNANSIANTQGWGVEVSDSGDLNTAVADDNLVSNNLIYGSLRAGINVGGWNSSYSGQVANGNDIYNNSLYNNDTGGGEGEIDLERGSNNDFENNIVYAGSANIFTTFADSVGSGDTGNTFNYNDWYSSSVTTATWGWFGNTETGLAAWQAASGQDANAIITNPQYTNPAADNFVILCTSPDRDTGKTLALVPKDYNNTYSRPIGPAYDRGAYEITCGTPTYTPTPTATNTATPTATPSHTLTPTPSATRTVTPTASPSNSMSPSATLSWTLSVTPTMTPTMTPSWTPTQTITFTPTVTRTVTLTATPTNSVSPSDTPTITLTSTLTVTPTVTLTRTPSPTPTLTDTTTMTLTVTLTITVTQTVTFTPTATSSSTPSSTRTMTPSATSTQTISSTPTVTPTATKTATPSNTMSPSDTSTVTATFTPTVTLSVTKTVTPSSTITATFSATDTVSPGPTPTDTVTPTDSPTVTYTSSSTDSPTATPTVTQTASSTASPTSSLTATPSATTTATKTVTPSATITVTFSATDTVSPGPTPTDTVTPTNSPTVTYTSSSTASPTATRTVTETASNTTSPTSSLTATLSATATVTPTSTPSSTPTGTSLSTFTDTPSSSPTLTASATATPTFLATLSDTPTTSPTATSTPTPSPSLTATSSLTSSPTLTHSPTMTSSSSPTSTFSVTVTLSSSPTPSATPTETRSSTPSSTDTPSALPSNTPSITLTASPSPTRSDSPTVTISPTVTQTPVPLPNQLVVTIFNSAGEIVRHLYTGSSQNLNNGFTTSAAAMVAGGTGVTINFGAEIQGGGNSMAWLGTNDNGQAVSGGSYTIQVQTTNAFGSTQSWTKAVTVLPQSASQILDIYNSAGELVATINPASFSSGPITNLGFANSSKSAFVLGSGGGVKFVMQDSNGTVSTTWNGKSNSGQMVAPGSYLVQLVDNEDGRVVIQSKGFVVLGDLTPVTFEVVAGPNPVGPMDRELVFNVTGLQSGQNAYVQLYNIAGERISQSVGVIGANKLTLSIGNWSSGLYVAVVESTEGPNVISRKLLHIAIER